MANISNPAEFNRQVFAQDGFRIVTTGFVHPVGEEYVAIYALTACVATCSTNSGDSLSSVSIPAGAVIYGDFASVSVSSGTIIAYIK